MTTNASSDAQSHTRLITAGPLRMQFDPASGLIRRLCHGDVELLRGVYAAVRDQHWNTVSPQISELQISESANHVDIQFVADCHQDEIRLRWEGRIHISRSGTMTYSFRAGVSSTFLRNRIGFCVLHPPDCAGKVCRVEHVDGSQRESVFPTDISPHQPIKNLRAIHQSGGT